MGHLEASLAEEDLEAARLADCEQAKAVVCQKGIWARKRNERAGRGGPNPVTHAGAGPARGH
jgi:hypothetical protein|eukprot:4838065-Prymnesium_polylepis.1